MANDGQVIIDVDLNTSKVEKETEQASKKIGDSLSKNINKSVNDVEKNVGKIGTAFNKINVGNLDKQFEKVDSAINKTTSQIDKQKLKLEQLKKAYENANNPKSQDKIKQQMENTTLSISRAEKQLDKLNNKNINLQSARSAINGLDGEFKSADASATKLSDKLDKLNDKNVKINVENNSDNSNDNASENIKKIGEAADDTGDKISGLGDELIQKVTIPLAGAGIAATKIGMDFQAQMSRVKAISGATGEEFKKLHDQALQLGKDTAFSAKQAAEGMEALASAGFSTNETMQAMPGLLDLAASSGESLASSSDIAASTLRGFGLEASQAGHVADVLAKNAGATNAAVSDTGEAMKYISPVAHSMGLSLEEVTAAIGLMSNAGIKGSQSGTTLRSALTRLASPSDEAAGAMETLGFKAFDSQGKLKPLSGIIDDLSKSLKGKTDQQKQDAIATIFGQEAMSGMITLIDGGSAALDALTNSYKTSDGAAKDMANTMQDNLKSGVEQMMGSIETAAIKLEEVAAPTLTKLANKVQELANEFADLPPETQESIIEFALMAAAVGPVVKVVGMLTSGIGGLITFGGRLATTLGLLEGTALTGFSVAGIAAAGAASALVVGVAGAVTYNELLSKSVNTSTEDLNMWEKAVNACTGGTIKSKAELQKAGLVYKDFGEGVSDSFKTGIEEATKAYHNFEMTLVGANSGTKITDEGKTKITSAINSMIDGAKSAISKRKGEVQGELSKLFNQEGGIDESEQTVLDEANKASDEKLKKIEEIQGQITGVWEKAIAEHGKLGEADIAKIKDYLKQVQQIRAEVEAKTTAESDFAKNQYSERLTGISAEDAKKEYQSASEELKKNFADARATYKTGIEELQNMVKKYNNEGNTEAAANAQKQVDAKKEEYNKLIKTEQDKLKEYRDILYKKNSALEGTMNEVDGSIFSKKDLNQKSNLEAIEKQYDSVANATETGMKRVQDSLGKWHDIYIDVDQSTGKIISAYDTFDGSYSGYSEKFATNAESTYKKVKESMDKLKDNILFGAKGLKLNDSNQVIKINADGTEEAITKLEKVIQKVDGTKVAIANINGEQVKIEFDSNGTITNIDDLLAAIRDHAKNSPAKVDVNIEDEEAMRQFEEIENQAKLLNKLNPNIDVKAEIAEAKRRLQDVKNALDRLKSKNIDVNINYTSDEFSNSQQEQSYSRALRKEMQTGSNYTGTNVIKTGLSTVHEHGWETANNSNVKMLNNGLAFLVGHHYTGGDGINDHMTSVNEMHNDINDAVNGKIGQVVAKLVNTLGGQKDLLNQVAKNTLDTANTGKEGVKINQKLATDLVSNISKSATGTFSDLQNQITSANDAKTKADKMKVEDNSNYARVDQQLDNLEAQIDDYRNRIDETTDESIKKQLEAEQKKLEKEKNIAEKEKELAKEVAENEINYAKESADQQVKIAEAKKEKLVKLSEAVTEALKTELEGQKAAAEKEINNELSSMEKSYNSKISKLEADTKKKSDQIDAQIKALENKTTEDSRDKERSEAKNNIYALETKMFNTASIADKRALQLQIDEAKKGLQEKEDTWNIDDQKQALEDEKTLLSERSENRKKSLEEQYNQEKEENQQELKDTDAYYDKLLETDSLNAQARYMMLQGNGDELVTLLNSYNPDWQNAGQSLADSLLTGLNSQKQSVQDAVSEMVGFKEKTTQTTSNVAYYDEKGNLLKEGYASGTNYNRKADYYLTNEKGWETASDGDVAYVNKGASIKNHMQSISDMKAEISKQLSNDLPYILSRMQSTIQEEQANMQRIVSNTVTNNSNTSQNIQYDGSNVFKIENLILNNQRDTEQFFNEAEVIRNKNRRF